VVQSRATKRKETKGESLASVAPFVRFCTQNTDKRRTLAITFPMILSQTCISSLLPLVNDNVLYRNLSNIARQLPQKRPVLLAKQKRREKEAQDADRDKEDVRKHHLRP
jgi:hypothetical protein